MLMEYIRTEKVKVGAGSLRAEDMDDAEQGDEQFTGINQVVHVQRNSKRVAQTNYPQLLCRKTWSRSIPQQTRHNFVLSVL